MRQRDTHGTSKVEVDLDGNIFISVDHRCESSPEVKIGGGLAKNNDRSYERSPNSQASSSLLWPQTMISECAEDLHFLRRAHLMNTLTSLLGLSATERARSLRRRGPWSVDVNGRARPSCRVVSVGRRPEALAVPPTGGAVRSRSPVLPVLHVAGVSAQTTFVTCSPEYISH